MDWSGAFEGFHCLDCSHEVGRERGRFVCSDCSGRLVADYDLSEITGKHHQSPRSRLPFPTSAFNGLGEGDTPLISVAVEDENGPGSLWLKAEGQNPTGSIADREMAVAVPAAAMAGVDEITLPTTGPGGVACAAYAGRAGVSVTCFVPTRSSFETKALINTYGGSMSVVEGRYQDALGAFAESESVGDDKHGASLEPSATPYRREGVKPLAYELVEELGEAPDAIVIPTSHGSRFAGVATGFDELAAMGVIERRPRLIAAQPAGCAPIVDGWDRNRERAVPVDHPDTICGPLEVPDPVDGDLAIQGVRDSGGVAVAAEDNQFLEVALDCSLDGTPVSVTGGVGLAAVRKLRSDGRLDESDTTVAIDPIAPVFEADLLRSQLMSRGQ